MTTKYYTTKLEYKLEGKIRRQYKAGKYIQIYFIDKYDKYDKYIL